MNGRLKKILLLALAVGLLVGVSRVQVGLNRDRERLGLTRVEPLENAPPVLAFTTVALGGFRGLIANALWIRATELQDDDKFFEMAQLADWITKLEPHFAQVWLVQAWNMAYNISVKFKDFEDRWRWVQRGIALLRDEGLRFNPNEVLIYRELAWFFQHKMGQNLDDANMYYKQAWSEEMARVFGKRRQPNLDELIQPQNDDARQRLRILTNEFKMDPQFMKKVDAQYGPLEWRLPEAHAIYWAVRGLEMAKANPAKVKAEDLIQLRRVIYQCLHLSVQRGRLVENPIEKVFEFGPNLDVIPQTSAAYEQAMAEDAPNRDHIAKAQRNFLRDAVYFLYVHDRLADAAKWYEVLSTKYPDKPLIDGDTNSLPRQVTLDRFAVAHVQEDVNETSQVKVRLILEGLLKNAYRSLLVGEDERAAGFRLLAQKVWDGYMRNIGGGANQQRIPVPPVDQLQRSVLNQLLDPEKGWPVEARAALRTKLGMPAETTPAPVSTNGPVSVPNNSTAPAAAPRR